jgi:hypothetical protein
MKELKLENIVVPEGMLDVLMDESGINRQHKFRELYRRRLASCLLWYSQNPNTPSYELTQTMNEAWESTISTEYSDFKAVAAVLQAGIFLEVSTEPALPPALPTEVLAQVARAVAYGLHETMAKELVLESYALGKRAGGTL